MQANKKITLFLIMSVSIFLLAGCPIFQDPIEVVLKPDVTERQTQQAEFSKRFEEPVSKGPTVVESAMELSEKYAKLSEEASTLRRKTQDIIAENLQLKDQVAALESELKQTQKELNEANDLLIEMTIELNNWKTDILGFRDEMRDADKAQLETLLKILKILGGEVKAESDQNEDGSSGTASTNEPGKPQLKETPTSGKSNE